MKTVHHVLAYDENTPVRLCKKKYATKDNILHIDIDPRDKGSQEILDKAEAEGTICKGCFVIVEAWNKGFRAGSAAAAQHIMQQMMARVMGVHDDSGSTPPDGMTIN